MVLTINDDNTITSTEGALVEHAAQPHDAMEFFVIKVFPSDQDNLAEFAQDLFEMVTKQFGGKTCVEISDDIQNEQRQQLHQALEKAGFVNPKLDSNIIAISRESLDTSIQTLKDRHQEEVKRFNDDTYKIETDKEILLQHNKEFLELLETSGYVTSTKVREGLYSELGMRERINHPNAVPVGIFHNGELIGSTFLFFYGDNTRVYVHDVTLKEEFRNIKIGGQREHFGEAFFVALYELISQRYPHVRNLWLIGGGDEKTAEMHEHLYREVLGGQSIVELQNNLNCGMYPKFQSPGPLLRAAGKRSQKLQKITLPNGKVGERYLALDETLTDNDRKRFIRLEEKELLARSEENASIQEKQKIQETHKTKQDYLGSGSQSSSGPVETMGKRSPQEERITYPTPPVEVLLVHSVLNTGAAVIGAEEKRVETEVQQVAQNRT